MFSRAFNIVMTPAVVLVGIASAIIYVYFGVEMSATDGAWPAFFWFAFYGHIVSALAATLVVGIPLVILAVLAASAAWMFGLGWRLQQRGVESLPFRVERKVPTILPEHDREALRRACAGVGHDIDRTSAMGNPTAPGIALYRCRRCDDLLSTQEGIEQMLDRLYLKIRQDAQADPSLPWREH